MSVCISIVVPVYNVENYVEECVKSILAQSYRDIEVICVDDGSTDGCPRILDEFAASDARVRVIHKENGGLVSARKAGVALATGDYIVHVDGDDAIAPDRIRNLVQCIEREQADVIIMAGEVRAIRESFHLREPDTPYRDYQGAEIREELLSQFVNGDASVNLNWGMWSVAAKRELAKNCQKQVDDRITYLEDFACLMLMLQTAEKVSVVKESGYYYKYRAQSITKQNDPIAVERLKIMWDFVRGHMERKWWESIAPHLRRYCVGQLLYKAYAEFLSDDYTYLYPFPGVKRGERIVVYGSGMFGTGMMTALKDSREYKVVAWVDENTENQPIEGLRVQSVDKIRDMVYNHIVIALMKDEQITRITERLLSEGIERDKIATVDRRMYKNEYLPKGLFEER